MTDMEQQMILALAAIETELGMPEDGCNSLQATLNAVRLLHAAHRDDAAEIESLRTEVAELDALRDKLSGLLSRTAVALRGPEPPLTRWSWHDLPERAAAAIAAIDVMQRVAIMAAEHD